MLCKWKQRSVKNVKIKNGIKNKIKTINGGKKGEYGKDFMKIKFNRDYKLSLNKPLKLQLLTIIVRCVFEEHGKFYWQLFLDYCLYEVWMLEYNRIDISEGIDVNKTSASKEYDICHYWYFKDIGFICEPYLCSGCHDLMQKVMSFNDAAFVYVKGSAYKIHFWSMSKDDVISIMNTSNLGDKKGIL